MDGLHVPIIPLTEVPGNEGTEAPSQIVMPVPKLNVGTTFGLTKTLNDAMLAHCVPLGVKI